MKRYLFLLPLIFFLARPVYAVGPHLILSPASGTYSSGSTFDIKVNVDNGVEKIGAVDVVLKFPVNILEVKTISDSKSFTNFYPSYDNTLGRVLITGSMPSGVSNYVTGLKELATITFSAKTTGTAGLAFDCVSGATNESNITKQIDSLDVIECSANVGGNYTIGGKTSSPTPTSAPVGGETKGGVPTAGNELPTVALLFSGIASLYAGFKTRIKR